MLRFLFGVEGLGRVKVLWPQQEMHRMTCKYTKLLLEILRSNVWVPHISPQAWGSFYTKL